MRALIIFLIFCLAGYFGVSYVYENNPDTVKAFTAILIPSNQQTVKDGLTKPSDTGDSSAEEVIPLDAYTSSYAASYEPYDDSKLVYAKMAPVILFFYADWCPSCVSTERIFAKKISTLPPGLKILKIDYDTAVDLKEKYKIEYQHTFIQVDENGNEIARWTGGAIDGILANLVQ
jgi:thiol-disulfide isomerase/thioredoxin